MCPMQVLFIERMRLTQLSTTRIYIQHIPFQMQPPMGCFHDAMTQLCSTKKSWIFSVFSLGFYQSLTNSKSKALSYHSIRLLTKNTPTLYIQTPPYQSGNDPKPLFWSPITKVYLCGLAFWSLHSPLRYGLKCKGLKWEYFQWKKTFCSTFVDFQS